MSALLVVLAMSVQAVAADNGPEGGASASTSATASKETAVSPGETPVKALTGEELREAVQIGLRRWTHPVPKDVPQAARELLALFQQVQGDKSLPSAQRESFRQRLRSRLIDLAGQINAKATHEARLAGNAPASVQVPGGRGSSLAQVGVARPFGANAAGGGNAPGVAGQGGFGPYATGPEDNGDQLVDLIQKTIAPHTWDVNGGPGVIYFWQPGRALVVRQSSEVQEQLGGLADQLRKAGN